MYSVIVVLSSLCLFVFVCIWCLSELYVLYWFWLDSGICIGLFITDWSNVSDCWWFADYGLVWYWFLVFGLVPCLGRRGSEFGSLWMLFRWLFNLFSSALLRLNRA
jgi:hypothetical protein